VLDVGRWTLGVRARVRVAPRPPCSPPSLPPSPPLPFPLPFASPLPPPGRRRRRSEIFGSAGRRGCGAGAHRWALGVGRWALGVGRWALGVGRWAFPPGRSRSQAGVPARPRAQRRPTAGHRPVYSVLGPAALPPGAGPCPQARRPRSEMGRLRRLTVRPSQPCPWAEPLGAPGRSAPGQQTGLIEAAHWHRRAGSRSGGCWARGRRGHGGGASHRPKSAGRSTPGPLNVYGIIDRYPTGQALMDTRPHTDKHAHTSAPRHTPRHIRRSGAGVHRRALVTA